MVRAMSVQLRSLRGELTAAGVFRTRELRSWLELAAMMSVLAMCLIGIALLGWIGALFLVPVAAVLCTSISMLGHEGSHRSFSASPARNAILCYLTFPLFGGLGALYWRNKHDRLHHGHPNVEGMDPDIRPFPFSSSRGDHERCGRKTRWFQRHFQRRLFWPMSLLMATGMRRSSVLYLIRYPKKREAGWWAEVLCMTAHYAGWVVVPSLIWGPLAGILVYVSIWGLVGVCLALVFAPAHMGLPIVADQNHDWLHQLETTRNLQLPRVISFFFIGLDYQVEHHLFPKIAHANLPQAAAITQAWCKRHGVTYQTMPYLDALGDAVRFMADAWTREASTASAMRMAS